MSPEAWIALIGAILTVSAIIYYAGKIVGKLDALGDRFDEHIKANGLDHSDLFRRVRENETDIARMQGGTPRRGSGGYAHHGAGE